VKHTGSLLSCLEWRELWVVGPQCIGPEIWVMPLPEHQLLIDNHVES